MRRWTLFIVFFVYIQDNRAIFKNNAERLGPCVIGTQKDRNQLKCTPNGYFEVKQCYSDFCVCVDPKTGHEATDTKTISIYVQPVCGNCHLEVAKALASNSSTIPQCQPMSGKYQSKQCQGDKKCQCVNEDNGLSRVPNQFKPNSELSCPGSDQRIAASLDSEPITADKTTDVKYEGNSEPVAPIANLICRLPKDAGHTCNNERTNSIQWYFDPETFECLAFNYKGCGGNKNRFYSPSDCWRHCKFADFGSCAGLKSPAKDAKDNNILCYQHGIETQKCPAGYTCTMLAFFAVCCHEKTEEMYNRNYYPTCANNKRAKQIESGDVPMTLIGKSCRDDFCPQNTTCKKLEVFAHCCPN